MTSLENLFSQFSVSPDLEIPAQISARVEAVKADFEVGEREHGDVIEYMLSDWLLGCG